MRALVVKTRFQLQVGNQGYGSISDCFKRIIREEGYRERISHTLPLKIWHPLSRHPSPDPRRGAQESHQICRQRTVQPTVSSPNRPRSHHSAPLSPDRCECRCDGSFCGGSL